MILFLCILLILALIMAAFLMFKLHSKSVAYRKGIASFIEKEKEIDKLANYDILTKIPNNRLFFRNLHGIINAYAALNPKLAVLFFDLDHFKKINDSLGHPIGDIVLKEFVARVYEVIPDTGFLARLNGNRFAIYMDYREDDSRLERCIREIQQAAIKLLINEEMHLSITASVGIAIFPDDGSTLESMIKHTDLALNRAKAEGKNTYRFYNTQMSEMITQKVTMEQSLKRALANKEFELYYQPQQDFITEKIRGVEALLRWKHPTRGFVSPVEFIPIAEETGIIIELGEWVLHQACQFIARMQKSGYAHLVVSVNISALQLARVDFVEMVLKCLADTGANADILELEITESMLIGSLDASTKTLLLLKEKGIRIALDDFGTGYSSLNYLRKLPINHLKIDKSFVQDVVGNPDEREIFNSIVDLVHKLQLTVTAEGIETKEQFSYVKQVGCNYMQGYYFSKPIPEEEVVLFLNAQKKE